MGIHLASQFRHAASREAEVTAAAHRVVTAQDRIANRTGNAGFLDWRTAPVSQGTAHCVKVRAINGPLSVSRLRTSTPCGDGLVGGLHRHDQQLAQLGQHR